MIFMPWAEQSTMQLAIVISKLGLPCHVSDASSQVSCWVPRSYFANMPLRCVSIVPLRWALATSKKELVVCTWNSEEEGIAR